MTERPITFNAEMMRALLDGRKTQTRRPIMAALCRHHCPYGVPGDRLYCQEEWAHYQTSSYIKRPDGRAFDELSDGCAGYAADGHYTIEDFRVHVAMQAGIPARDVLINGDRWRPAKDMPRWASRALLEITDVRVERVQEISIDDIEAEGVYQPLDGEDCSRDTLLNRLAFENLWDAIYADKGLGWDANPFVWVIEFKRLEVKR